ncbi:MAG: BamA/TamA family outer membrane protein [Bacteroidales bacterium]|nr:BamA/TamA family outer membrane protein [Bacteroidales bacterium]
MRFLSIISICSICALMTSCSMTKVIPEGQSMLVSNEIEYTTKKPEELLDLPNYIKQTPKRGILGFQIPVAIYNTGNGTGRGWDKIAEKMGTPPLIFDEALVKSSVNNMLNHMKYKGFYHSSITTQVKTDKKKTKVTYTVTPGNRYVIDSVSYDIPDVNMYDIMSANQKESLVKPGVILSEDLLEKESERLAAIYRSSGYYGFDKSFFFFTGDTLAHNGRSHLDMAIKEYPRNGSENDARKHRIFSFDKVFVSTRRNFQQSGNIDMSADSAAIARRDSLLRVWRSQIDTVDYRNISIINFSRSGNLVRKKVLDRLNLIVPGQQYDESLVETTYSRFAGLNLFSSVNIQQQETDSSKVQTMITLQAGNVQGFKVDLQGSTNSNGLLGVSPSLSYFHKNLFRGAELLTISLMGDFQFKFNSNIHSTELGLNATLDIPRFLLAPNSWFRSKTVPHTEIIASFSYQTRPEYTRNIISGSYNYSWNIRRKLHIKATPLRVNIVRMFNIDTIFYEMLSDPFLKNSYSDHFDIGVGTSLYYISDVAAKPKNDYFYIRYSLDLSGNVLSLMNGSLKKNDKGERLIWKSPYSQYFRTELSGVYTFKFGNNPNHMLAIRALGGVGKGYGNSHMLPLEKMFWGGGAYDMRGWQPRTLGPGYAPRDSAFTIPNQTGDIKLEGNLEYRFPIVSMFNGAIFTDIGNIWTFDRKATSPDDVIEKRGVFRMKDFYKHLAWDVGAGLRLDLDFAVIRLDLGFKTFNPATSEWTGPGKWFKKDNFEISFGIGYPF